MPTIYIAGAHSRAITTAHYLQYLNPEIQVESYLYNNDEDNPSEVDGIPVRKIDENSRLNVENTVYIGTRGVNQENLTKTLLKCGMKHIIPVDVKLDMDLRNQFLSKYFASLNRKYVKIYDFEYEDDIKPKHNDVTIFVANSAVDKPLTEHYEMLEVEKLIQVGTCLTKQRLQADYFDNFGDNISNRNSQFCELTALYWIWKNATDKIVGLTHYRRHFILPKEWLGIMQQNNIDAILPVPLYVHPTLEANYRVRHVGEILDTMYEYLKKNRLDEYESVKKFFNDTPLYSPCNMIIARKDVFNELCEWLFPILFYVADQHGILHDSYQNRYPGFLSERLITYFFEKNRNRLKTVYADKNFLK
ncbi:MAG: DUF4422 domain-containing protein [Pseudobutyrivibrio sp.]|nr:DUF4422 domain-containing protein [Pseudobutyrivibrio sp.]